MRPTEHRVTYWLAGAFYHLAYVAWGDPAAEKVLCVHGLTRTGRDFDALAAALADRFYVVCPDLPGRGKSGWLASADLYQPPNYVAALAHLLSLLGAEVHWIGTSLGGICGMLAAAAPLAPVRSLVLNDIGARVPAAALARIRDYIGDMPHFIDIAQAEDYLRRVHAPFGPLTDAQWRHLAETSVRKRPDGGLALHFDPAMIGPVTAGEPADLDLSPFWNRITLPTLVLRGESSDLLLPHTLAMMSAKSCTHTVPDCGHAPALMDAPTIAVIRNFLTKE